jgi:hypothetical protein
LAKLSIGSSTYSGTMVSFVGSATRALFFEAMLNLADLEDSDLSEEISETVSMGVPSGLRPMSASRLYSRCLAVFKADDASNSARSAAAVVVYLMLGD